MRMIFYKLERTTDGRIAPVEQFDMSINPSSTNLLFVCPLVIEHPIDRSSPLYPISPQKLYDFERRGFYPFEIAVIVEGTMETTGDACQYRTSYKPREILWGFRFKQTRFSVVNGRIDFDMSTFEEFEPVRMDTLVNHQSDAVRRKKRRQRRNSIGEENKVTHVNAWKNKEFLSDATLFLEMILFDRVEVKNCRIDNETCFDCIEQDLNKKLVYENIDRLIYVVFMQYLSGLNPKST